MHEVIEREEEAVVDIFGLIRLKVKHVRTLPGAARRLERCIKRFLLIPSDLHLDVGFLRFEVLSRFLDPGYERGFVRAVAPNCDRCLGGGRRTDESRRYRDGSTE